MKEKHSRKLTTSMRSHRHVRRKEKKSRSYENSVMLRPRRQLTLRHAPVDLPSFYLRRQKVMELTRFSYFPFLPPRFLFATESSRQRTNLIGADKFDKPVCNTLILTKKKRRPVLCQENANLPNAYVGVFRARYIPLFFFGA